MREEVGRDEEDVENAAAAIDAYEGELVRQPNGERDMVGEGEAEEEYAREESEKRAEERDG